MCLSPNYWRAFRKAKPLSSACCCCCGLIDVSVVPAVVVSSFVADDHKPLFSRLAPCDISNSGDGIAIGANVLSVFISAHEPQVFAPVVGFRSINVVADVFTCGDSAQHPRKHNAMRKYVGWFAVDSSPNYGIPSVVDSPVQFGKVCVGIAEQNRGTIAPSVLRFLGSKLPKTKNSVNRLRHSRTHLSAARLLALSHPLLDRSPHFRVLVQHDASRTRCGRAPPALLNLTDEFKRLRVGDPNRLCV